MDIYDPVIAEMKAQIEECQLVIATLEMRRAKGGATPVSVGGTPAVTSQPVTFGNDAFFNMTLAEGAKKYLAATKKTATSKTIAEALIAGGMKTSAKNFVDTVRSKLSKHHYFASVNGEWGLAEWYPGRKTSPKKSGAGASQEDDDPTPEQVDAVIAQVASEPQQPS
jgi:hypothetical protein